MVQALFATCKHILYGIENDKNDIIYSIKRTSNIVRITITFGKLRITVYIKK